MRPSASTARAGLSVWNGSRPGASAFQRAALERKARAAILHQHAGCRAARRRSRIPSRATGCRKPRGRRRRRCPSRRCRQPCGGRPGCGLASIDRSRFRIEKLGIEIAFDGAREPIGIGDDGIAHAQGPFGGLDQAVDVIEAFTFGDAQALEQREHHQRSETLGRRRRVERRAGLERDRQRLGEGGPAAPSRSARVTGLPMRSRSPAISRPTSPR